MTDGDLPCSASVSYLGKGQGICGVARAVLGDVRRGGGEQAMPRFGSKGEAAKRFRVVVCLADGNID